MYDDATPRSERRDHDTHSWNGTTQFIASPLMTITE